MATTPESKPGPRLTHPSTADTATAVAVQHARQAHELLAQAELARPAGLVDQMIAASSAHAQTALAWAKIAANRQHQEYRGQLLTRRS